MPWLQPLMIARKRYADMLYLQYVVACLVRPMLDIAGLSQHRALPQL